MTSFRHFLESSLSAIRSLDLSSDSNSQASLIAKHPHPIDGSDVIRRTSSAESVTVVGALSSLSLLLFIGKPGQQPTGGRSVWFDDRSMELVFEVLTSNPKLPQNAMQTKDYALRLLRGAENSLVT